MSNMNNTALLEQFGFLAVTGKEALSFLQGYTTCDLEKLTVNNSSPGAICNIKGRMISNFRAVPFEDGFLLRMDRKLVPVTIEFLLKYIVFSKAEMTDLSDTYYCYGMMGSADNFPQADNTSSQINSDTVVCVSTNDQRYEIWSTEEKTTSDDARQWMSAEVRDGFAWVDETSTDSFIPQMFNLHAIEGISFEKGCYLGQEIVARLQYRGKLTKRLHRGRSDHATNTGDSLFNKEQKSVGTIVSSQKPDFLAVIQTKSGGDDSYQFSDGTTVELIDLAPQSG